MSTEFKQYSGNYTFDGVRAYEGYATLDLSSIEINTFNFERVFKLWIEQNGTFKEVLTFPLKKKIISITKPDDDKSFTLGAFRDLLYPIGGIYISTNNIDPGTFIGGTWETITSPITGSYAWKRTA